MLSMVANRWPTSDGAALLAAVVELPPPVLAAFFVLLLQAARKPGPAATAVAPIPIRLSASRRVSSGSSTEFSLVWRRRTIHSPLCDRSRG
jgi:hypothetical protein